MVVAYLPFSVPSASASEVAATAATPTATMASSLGSLGVDHRCLLCRWVTGSKLPDWSARDDPPSKPKLVARREQFLTVRQGCRTADSANGPLRAGCAIRRSRRRVELPFLAAQVSAHDRAGALAPDLRVDVPHHREGLDPRDGQQLSIRAELIAEPEEWGRLEGRQERAGPRAGRELVAVAETGGRVPQPRLARHRRGCKERVG